MAAEDIERDNYFASYEDIEVHRLMVSDKPRTEAYRNAILKNEHLFKGKVVMDIGAGTGILSLFAAKAGAKKVYAIEASNLAELIPDVAAANGFSKIIEVLHSKLEDVELRDEERVDVIVSEWMGFYLFHESMLSSVLLARDKFLSADGAIFPSEATLYACPCSLENLYKEQFSFWDDVYGFDMSSIKKYARKLKSLKPEIYKIKPTDLLSEAVIIKSINLHYVSQEEIDAFESINFVDISKTGIFQGVALWFDCYFDGRTYDEHGKEHGNMVSLSTSPFSPETHWKQTVIVFQTKRDTDTPTQDILNSPIINSTDEEKLSDDVVEKNEVVGWKLEFTRNSFSRNYAITLEILDPEEHTHPVPCGCSAPKCLIIAKMIENENNMVEND